MSSSVESRIVSMKFDNRDFERGVSTTLRSLGTLSRALDAGFTSKAAGGLSRIGSAIKGFSFGSMGSAVDGISGKFIALSTVAVTALSRITNAAISAGIDFAKQFTGLRAAQQGFEEYETKLGSIQTILANTDRDLNNQKDLNEVTQALDQLNRYSDQTIYNFGEMARNIGTFTAAGVDLETSVNSIKGIANIAALSGSNAQQASTAMYQLSQAIAAGRVGLQDWNSVVNAGMGGKVFQEALTRTAVAMGEIDESAVKLNRETGQMTINGSSFRESISAIGEEKWLTGNVLTNTLAQFSGDLTDAQLRTQGFTNAQIKDIRKLADTAVDAATKVKTITQLVGTIQEALASGWAKTWEIVIGDFGEAKRLFTSINDVVGGFIQRQSEARNKVLEDWKEAGGRTDLLAGLENLFRVFLKIARPIRNAFRDIFPPATGEQLAKITEGFRKFTEGLLFGQKHSKNIKEIFRGIFTIFRVGFGILGGIIKYVAEFFGIIVTGGGGDALGALLGLVSEFANIVTWLGKWLEEGDKLKNFFDTIIEARNAVLEPLVGTIGAVVEALVALARGDVSGFFDKLADAGNEITQVFQVVVERLQAIGGGIGDFFSSLGAGGAGAFASTVEFITNAIDTLREKLNFGGGDGLSLDTSGVDKVGKEVEKLSWIATVAGAIWDGLTATLSGVASLFDRFGGRMGQFFTIMGDKILTFIETMSMDDLVAIVNTGVFVMLYRAVTKLANTTGGILGFGESATQAFDQVTGTLKTMQNTLRAQMLITIAGAVALLAAALIGVSLIPKEKLAGALGAISALLGQVMLLMVGMGKLTFGTGVLAIGPAMIGIATAMLIMAGALRAMEGVKWSAMGKMAVVLGLMTVALMGLGNMFHLFAAGAAMAALAVGMTVMAAALVVMEHVKWQSIGKMAVILTAIGLALAGLGLVGPAVLAGAAAILIMGPALGILAVSLLLLGTVDWSAIGKLAVVLLTVAVSLTAMVAALPGAFALMTLSVALTLLMPVLASLGAMDFGTFAKSIGFLIVTLVALGAVGAVFGVLSPLIAAFGAALTIVGVALVLVGTGTFAFAAGLAILAASGTAAFAVLAAGITTFLVLLPQWIVQFGQTIRAIITLIRDHGPPFVRAMTAVIRQLIRSVGDMAPDLGRTTERLIEAGLRVIRNTSDDFIRTGIQLIEDLLEGLGKNAKDLADKGADAVIKFLEGIQDNDDKVAREGVQTVRSLVRAIGGAITDQIGNLFGDALALGRAIINGIIAGIASLLGSLLNAAVNAVQNAYEGARNWLQSRSPSRRFMTGVGMPIGQGMALGISKTSGLVTKEAVSLGQNAMGALSDTMSNLSAALESDLEYDPMITPVLDLSQVQSEASRIAGLLTPSSIDPGVSLAEARALSDQLIGLNSQNGGDSGAEIVKEITFNQTLNSPKAINAGEHYRQTRNLLSLKAKELNLT